MGDATTEPMDDLWKIDAQLLAAVVRVFEIDGQEFPDMPTIYDAVGLDHEVGRRSVRRLVDADMITTSGSRRGGMGGVWVIDGVTEKGLRRSGAWPGDADRLAEQIIAALAQAAEREPEADRRERLRRAAGGIAAVGRDDLAEVLETFVHPATRRP